MTALDPTLRTLDLFAGAGGSSCGARMAGAHIVAAVDSWPLAQKTYIDNFAGVVFRSTDCGATGLPKTIKEKVGPIKLLLASPECTNHTCAKGGGERSEESRKTAFQVVRFAKVLKPRWIVVENVIHMRTWDQYAKWLEDLRTLKYKIREQVLNAADFGVPQARKRLFVTCDLDGEPPEILAPEHRVAVAADDIIEKNGMYSYSPLRSMRRAQATIARADRAIEALGDDNPFLLVYYGTDGAGGWQRVDTPLRTITTLDRFAYVRPGQSGQHEMRMLQVPELKKAMGFPDEFKLNHGVRRDKIKLLGNAVCPPVMKAVVEALTQRPGSP